MTLKETAKEKAHKLVQMFTALSFDILYSDGKDGASVASGMCTIANAKQCALVLVDEVMVAIDDMEDPTIFINGMWYHNNEFWAEVTQQIKELYN